MKANLVSHGEFHALVLDNEERTSYLSESGEDKKVFAQRITEKASEDLMEDVEIVKEITDKNFKSQKLEKLKEKLEAAEGLEADLISDVIAMKEGRFEAPDAEPGSPREESDDEPKAKAPKEPKAPKAPKVVIPPLTDEEKEELKKNKGSLITFIPHTGDEPITGVIKGLMHDKRVAKTYYRIEVEEGDSRRTLHKEVHTIGMIIEKPEPIEEPEAGEENQEESAAQ